MSKKAEDEAAKKAAEEAAAAAKKAEEDAAAEAAKKAEEEKAEEDKKKKSEKTFTKAELEAEKKKAVDEAQKKFEAEKDLTELERYKKENEELKASERLRNAKEEVVEALKKAGSKAADLAFEAIQGKLKFDDAGKLLNSKDLIDGLKTSYPDQFGVEAPAGGIEGGAGQKDTSTKLTAEKLGTMTPDEINKLDWAEVSAVLAGK